MRYFKLTYPLQHRLVSYHLLKSYLKYALLILNTQILSEVRRTLWSWTQPPYRLRKHNLEYTYIIWNWLASYRIRKINLNAKIIFKIQILLAYILLIHSSIFHYTHYTYIIQKIYFGFALLTNASTNIFSLKFFHLFSTFLTWLFPPPSSPIFT